MIYSPKKFAEDTGVSQKLATRLLDALYNKDLTAEDINALIWRLRDWFIKNEMPSLIEKLDDGQINAIIDQMLVERAMWNCPQNICGAETEAQLEKAFKSFSRPESAWLFSELQFADKKDFKAGDVVTIQIMRVGTWAHPMYGEVKIDKQVIQDVVQNFQSRERGIDLCVDENHEDNHKALAWFKELYTENNDKDLFAKVELTERGAELMNEGAYKYFSPEIVFHKTDEETGKEQQNLLIGGAFTNRPFFKAMKPLMASEESATNAKETFLLISNPKRMNKFLEILGKFADMKSISKQQAEELKQAYSEVAKEHHSKAFDEAVEEVAKKAEGGDEETPPPATPPAPEGEEPVVVPPAEGTPPETPAVQATENADGTFTVPAEFMTQFSEMQSTVTKMRTAKRFNETSAELSKSLFSEKNPQGFILPKDTKEFTDFVCSLSEVQAKKLMGFIKKFKVIAETKGSNGGTFDADKSDPTVELNETDEVVQHYMSPRFNQTKEAAIASARRFYELKKKSSK